jgi:hypothetical protein
MKLIKINVDAVPEDKRTHPDFLGLLNSMTLGMADPAKVLSVCTHEAGHFFFGLANGMKILSVDGPRIVYIDPDGFQGRAARVNIEIVKNTVEQIAIMLCAGGIASLEIDNALGSGDSEDRELFNATCQNVGVNDAALIDSLWKDGQNVVRAQLQNPALKQKLRELAQRLIVELEGLA